MRLTASRRPKGRAGDQGRHDRDPVISPSRLSSSAAPPSTRSGACVPGASFAPLTYAPVTWCAPIATVAVLEDMFGIVYRP